MKRTVFKSVIALSLALVLCLAGCSLVGGSPEAADTQMTASATTTTTAAEEQKPVEPVIPYFSEDYDYFINTVVPSHELTVVNVWATWCGPCVSEMPILQKLYEEFDGKVAMVGVMADEDMAAANDILKENGIGYYIFANGKEFNEKYCQNAIFLPCTYFLDSEGNLMNEAPVYGANYYTDWKGMIDNYRRQANAS